MKFPAIARVAMMKAVHRMHILILMILMMIVAMMVVILTIRMVLLHALDQLAICKVFLHSFVVLSSM